MAASIALMSEFEMGTDFTEYSERFENFLIANRITEPALKRATFLAAIGAAGYKLIRSLCQNSTSDKSFEQLVTVMKQHLQPTPNVISERYRFYKHDRITGESVTTYISELRKLSEHCQFADKLNEYLRDKLVCGLNSERVQQKLLSMKDLTLEAAIDTAVSFETACKDAKIIHGGSNSSGVGSVDESINRVGSQNQERRECYRCGSVSHLANSCPFKMKSCFGCGRVGHTKRRCCMEKKSEDDESKKDTNMYSGVGD